MKKTLFALFLSYTFFASAQDYKPGYIITNEYDTIYGQFLKANDFRNYSQCNFEEGGVTKKYLPEDIAAFSIEGLTYVSGVKDSSFVRVLITGEVSLYLYDDHYYVKKGGKFQKIEEVETITKIDGIDYLSRSSAWKGVLSYLTGDCEAGKIDPQKINFVESDIHKSILKYNKCTGKNYIDYKRADNGESKFSLNYGLSISQNSFKKITADRQTNIKGLEEANTSYFWSFGVRFIASSPRLSSSTSFQGDIIYSTSQLNSSETISIGSIKNHYSHEHSFSSISIPLVINQSIPLKLFEVFMQVGLSNEFYFNTSSHYMEVIEINGDATVLRERTSAIEINKNSLGFLFGGGVMTHFRKFDLGFRTRYIYLPKFAENIDEGISTSRVSFSLILETK